MEEQRGSGIVLLTMRLTLACLLLSLAACSGRGDRYGSDAGVDLGPCTPGVHSCADGIGEVCASDGHRFRFECDPVQGLACNPDGCAGVCNPYSLQGSYVGCDYAPTVTTNPVWSEFHFAVAVASTSDDDTHVTVTRGDDTIATQTVPPHGTVVVQLPWVPELKGDEFIGTLAPDPGDSRLVVDGAYRLRTDRPVTAYQFSPYEYTLGPISTTCPNYDSTHGGCNSFSNDASLLLPKNVLGREYTVASWASGGSGPSLYAITATEDATSVHITGHGTVRAGGGVGADGNATVMLDAGDVLEVIGTPAPMPDGGLFPPPGEYGTDLTSTHVSANKPVQVIGGNGCANAPAADTGYCDHVEEVLFPDATLDMDYFASVAVAPMSSGEPTSVLRVIATTPGTTVHFDPPISPDVTLDAATPFVDVPLSNDVHVTADHRVSVAQYMVGSTIIHPGMPTTAEGDPSESLVVPTSRFRRDYQFFTSTTYHERFVNIVAPTGAMVVLDGRPLPASEFRRIGGADFGVAHESLTTGPEVHQLTSDVPVGITVYGYAPYTSFMYPGGLDLVSDLI